MSACIGVYACSDGGPTQPQLADISVSLATATLQVGENVSAAAILRDASGARMQGVPVTWLSSNASIASVNSAGVVTALLPGSAQITAASQGLSGSAAVTVVPVPVASVEVTLALKTLFVGASTQATAVTRDASGGVLAGRAVTWSSDNTAVATVTGDGAVTAVAVGTATISAASEGKSGSVALSVALVPVAAVHVTIAPSSISAVESAQASAAMLDSAGHELAGRIVTWSSSDTTVATVTPSGAISAVAAGASQITATSEGRSGGALLTVTPAPVSSMSVTLSSGTVLVGQHTQASVVLLDARGAVLTNRQIVWGSSDERVATVSADGTVAAIGAGTVAISATSEGKSGSASLSVLPIPVAAVSVSLEAGSVTAVGTTQASATLRGAHGELLSGRDVTWSSGEASIATVSQAGVVSGISVGAVSIVATSEGQSGATTLTVTPAPVATVAVSLAAGTVTAVDATQATVTLRDARGRELTGRAVAWTSSAPAVATVSESGAVTAIAEGAAQITATSEGQSGAATLTVTPAPVATVSVSLVPASVIAGQPSQASATLRDARGRTLSGRPLTWTSDATPVATVSATGAITTLSAGSATITATSEDKGGSATLTVTPVPVASVSVTVAPTTVTVGQTAQASALTLDAANAPLNGRAVVWTTDNAAVAIVSSSGVVTAVAPGTVNVVATSEGHQGSAALSVIPVPVAIVTVSLEAGSITAVGTTQATVTLHGAHGELLSGREVTWSSGDATIAAVSQAGVVTGVNVGTVSIVATSEGQSGAATLTVTPAPVATVTVALAASTVTAVDATQATVTLRDAGGRELTGRAVAWNSSDVSVATISPVGAITALAQGATTITATSEGRSGTATLTVTPAPVATVSVSLAPASVSAAQPSQASATLKDSRGRTLSGRPLAWVSDATTVATVSASGAITTLSAGTATITATSEGKSGAATLTVTPAPVANVSVSLTPSVVTAVQTSQAAAMLTDAQGVALTGRAVEWSSSNLLVATISPSGAITALASGTAVITATSEGRSGTATLTVTPAPVATVSVALAVGSITAVGATQATATVRDARGAILTDRTVAWASDNPAVATISPAGALTGVSVGSALISATSEGVSGSAMLAVTPAPVATVSVSLAATTLTAVDLTQGTATLRDALGRTLTGRTVVWSSSDAAVATISQEGAITAIAEGTTTITASSEGQGGTATLTVSRAPVASVSVALAPASVTAGQPSVASATLRDARGRTLTGRPLTWTSDATTVATISATGEITTLTPGTAIISAASEGTIGSATLTVTPVPVATVTVAVAPANVMVGQTASASAVTLDSANTPLSGRSVAWTSDNPAVAIVNASGVVTTVAPGTAHVVATSEGHQGSAAIIVVPVPVASVTVSLAQSTVITGQSTAATAVAHDSSGNVLTGRAFVWATADAAVATVSAEGLVSGVAPGVTTITAASEGKAGSVTVTIIPVPVAAVSVALAASSIVEGQGTQATATTSDAAGNILADRPVTWSSDNPAVATVSPAGVVSAIVPGTAHIQATSEGITGVALLTVTPIPVAKVTVSFGAEPLVQGFTTQATAGILDAAGNQLLNRTVVWSSDVPSVATVSSTGVVSAHFPGTAEIAATVDGVTGSRMLTISPAPIATVSVSLSSTLLEVGQSTGASVVLRDALGNVLTQRTSTWSSDNEATATVSPTGVVTATGTGTAHIIATSEGQSGNALLTVPNKAPSAEPLGLTPLTQRSFDALEEDGWTTTVNSLPYYSIVSDAAAPRSPSNVGQIRYPAGWLGGDSPALTGRDLNHSATTIYLSMWMKFSSNWVGHPTGTNKIIHLWISHINRVYLFADGSDANVLTPRIGLQSIAGSYDNGFGTVGQALDLRPNLPGQLDAQLVRGQWHHWELVLTSNTDGLANGSVDWWLDGVQVGHYTGIPFVDVTETRTWDFIGFDPTWGGRDGVLDAEQSIFMDHIFVSGKP